MLQPVSLTLHHLQVQLLYLNQPPQQAKQLPQLVRLTLHHLQVQLLYLNLMQWIAKQQPY